MNFLNILVFCLTINQISSVCPESESIKPCVCDEGLRCEGVIDLDKIFDYMKTNLKENEKHFKFLDLENTTITELKENQFRDITFGNIHVKECPHLKTIHENAFNHTDQVTHQVFFNSNPMLTFASGSIFNILSKFKKANNIFLKDSNIDTIPSNSFKSDQVGLKHISFVGHSFKVIENKAFSLLKNLKYVGFARTSIEIIPENAFHFEDSMKSKLSLSFHTNPKIKSSSFSSNSLLNINRPVLLELHSTEEMWDSLDESIFKPLLEKNPDNKIEIDDFDCNDCSNYWLIKNQNFLDQVYLDTHNGEHLICSEGNNVTDSENFAKCAA